MYSSLWCSRSFCFLWDGDNINIFIGCSSRVEIDKKYIDDADFISKELADYGYDLIIGGISNEGMFGKILNNFSETKKKINVYTLKLYNEDVNLYNVGCKYVKSTFERTENIYKDAFKILILPGGTGSLAELFGMLEDNRTIECTKEIIIYNQDGYYDDLIRFIKKLIDEKFNDYSILNYIKIFNKKEDLIKYLEV